MGWGSEGRGGGGGREGMEEEGEGKEWRSEGEAKGQRRNFRNKGVGTEASLAPPSFGFVLKKYWFWNFYSQFSNFPHFLSETRSDRFRQFGIRLLWHCPRRRRPQIPRPTIGFSIPKWPNLEFLRRQKILAANPGPEFDAKAISPMEPKIAANGSQESAKICWFPPNEFRTFLEMPRGKVLGAKFRKFWKMPSANFRVLPIQIRSIRNYE